MSISEWTRSHILPAQPSGTSACHVPIVEDRVYIIGHPKGDELAYSLQRNLLLGLNAERIHYRSPTEPGSSGSPLFNDAGQVIGQLFGSLCDGACEDDGCHNRHAWFFDYGRFDVSFSQLRPYVGDAGEWVRLGGVWPLPDGSPLYHWNSLAQGIANTPASGRIWLHASSSAETGTFSQPVTLDAANGPATIGN